MNRKNSDRKIWVRALALALAGLLALTAVISTVAALN